LICHSLAPINAQKVKINTFALCEFALFSVNLV
jgi:hypothetical protein